MLKLSHLAKWNWKKSARKAGIIIGLLLVATVLIMWLVGAQIKLVTGNGLIIKNDPSLVQVNAIASDQTKLAVEITTQTFFYCRSDCSYSLFDVATNTSLQKTDLTITDDDSATAYIKLPSHNFTRGQALYSMQVVCQTKQTVFCPTNETVYTTTLIVQDINISQTDQVTRVKLQPHIDELQTQTIKLTNNAFIASLLANITAWKTDPPLIQTQNALEIIATFNTDNYDQLSTNKIQQAIGDIQYQNLKINAFVEELNASYQTRNYLIEIIKDTLNNISLERIEHATLYQPAQVINKSMNELKIIMQTFTNDINLERTSTRTYLLLTRIIQQKISTQELDAFTTILSLQANITPELTCEHILALTNTTYFPINRSDILDQIPNEYQNITSISNDTQTDLDLLTRQAQIFCSGTFNLEQTKKEILSKDTLSIPAIASMPTSIDFVQPRETCCAYNDCKPCSHSQATLLIHGYSIDGSNDPTVTLKDFAHLQQLWSKNGIVDGGELNLNNRATLRVPVPISFSTSYYYRYGWNTIQIQTTERIENYALRLRENIDRLTIMTGEKTTLIAHSMGGLVSRAYISLFGENQLKQLITLNTPHQGVIGRTADSCNSFGARKECEDMLANSTFIRSIVNVKAINTTAIYSVGCDTDKTLGDGVVHADLAQLPGATMIQINGTCTDILGVDLHGTVLREDRFPTVSSIIQKLIKN